MILIRKIAGGESFKYSPTNMYQAIPVTHDLTSLSVYFKKTPGWLILCFSASHVGCLKVLPYAFY